MNFNYIVKDKKQLVVAEIAQSHDGSLNYVHSFIDEVARAGADVLNFKLILLMTSLLRKMFSYIYFFKKETRFEYWKRMQFQMRNGWKFVNM